MEGKTIGRAEELQMKGENIDGSMNYMQRGELQMDGGTIDIGRKY